MTQSTSMSRRRVLQACGASVLVSFIGSQAVAADLPPVLETDANAMGLGYKVDATTVDVAKYPQRAGDANAGNLCSNCALYTGADNSESGPCGIFPGKSVAAKGWCVAWAKKP